MIKKITLIVISIGLITQCFGQEIPKDKNNKYVFLVNNIKVKDSTMKSDKIYKLASEWLTQKIYEHKNQKLTEDDFYQKKLTAHLSDELGIPSVISKIPHGRLEYDFTIETKDKKFRVIAENFLFHPYHQDRNMKYVLNGTTKKFEDEKYPGFNQVWKKHKLDTFNKLVKMTQLLTEYIDRPEVTSEKVNEEKW